MAPISRFLLLSLALLAPACTSESESEVSEDPAEEVEESQAPAPEFALQDGWTTMTVSVEGMSCAANCAPRVATAALDLPWVKECEVDFESKTAFLAVVEDETDAEALVAALGEEGFTATLN